MLDLSTNQILLWAIVFIFLISLSFIFRKKKDDEYFSWYDNEWRLTEKAWNNKFAYEIRKNRTLYVPFIIRSDEIFDCPKDVFKKYWDRVNLIDKYFIPEWILTKWDEIVFEEEYKGTIRSCVWLSCFVACDWKNPDKKDQITPIYIFDNHNHAFFFWIYSIAGWDISSPFNVIHVDEHSDMRESEIEFEKFILDVIWADDKWIATNFISEIKKPWDVQKMLLDITYAYTNEVLNVWNYIRPAQKFNIIKELVPVQSETHLDYIENKMKNLSWSIVLNLDMDFFSKWMEYIPYSKKIEKIRYLASKADVITISTSPYFMDQDEAIRIIYDIFWTTRR